MSQSRNVTKAMLIALALLASLGTKVAAQCGSTAAGYDTWKRQFAAQARGKGTTASSLAALTATSYATATIAADGGQRSPSLSLEQFLASAVARRSSRALVA